MEGLLRHFGRCIDVCCVHLGFVVFTIGSALSGIAGTGETLVVYRVIQGIGAALLTANSSAIISESFPENERGKAFGANAIVWGMGAVLGIILGVVGYSIWRVCKIRMKSKKILE